MFFFFSVILLSDVPLLTEDFYQVLLGEFAFRRVFCAVFYVTEQTALEVLVKVLSDLLQHSSQG